MADSDKLKEEGVNPEPVRNSWARSDKIAALALLLTIPGFIVYIVSMFNTWSLQIAPLTAIELRSGEPILVSVETDGKSQIEVNLAKTTETKTYMIIPVVYLNEGDRGDVVSIVREAVTLKNNTYGLTYEFEAKYDTDVVPAESRNAWFGDVKAWLPTVLEGGQLRRSEVVMECKSENCKWSEFIAEFLDKPGEWTATLSLTVPNHGIEGPKPCTLDLSKARLEANATLNPTHRKWYRRSVYCK